MALRPGYFFGTGAEFWMNLQMRFDLETAEDEHGKEIILEDIENVRKSPGGKANTPRRKQKADQAFQERKKRSCK